MPKKLRTSLDRVERNTVLAPVSPRDSEGQIPLELPFTLQDEHCNLSIFNNITVIRSFLKPVSYNFHFRQQCLKNSS